MGARQRGWDDGAKVVSGTVPISSRPCTRELLYTYTAIFFTLAFLAIGVFAPAWDLAHRIRMRSYTRVGLDGAVVAIVCMYVWGQLIYEPLLTRYAAPPPIDPDAKEWLKSLYDPDVTALEGLLHQRLPELRASW